MADPTTAGGGKARLRSGLADALKRWFGVSAWQADAHAASLLERGPLADFLARTSAEQARAETAQDRLLVAFHDAIRRPLGVTPDSGAEFYSHRMAEEAEERRAAGTRRIPMPSSPTARDAAEGLAERHLCPTGETFSRDDVVRALAEECEDAGTQRAWALSSGFTPTFVSAVLRGRKALSPALARAAGFEPVTVYRPITEAGRRALHARTSDGGEA